MRIIAVDTETDLIGQPDVVPQLVCSTWSERGVPTLILGSSPEDLKLTRSHLKECLEDKNITLIFHNNGYDMAVFLVAFPELVTLIFQAHEDGRIDDTGLREKLLNLSTHGNLAYAPRPDGSNSKIFYKLSDLVFKYMGIDRTMDKVGDDIWRLNYYILLGEPLSEYPQDALDYAMTDSDDTLNVYYEQDARIENEIGRGSVNTSHMRAAVSFALQLMTAWGLKVDQFEVERIDAFLEEELSPEKLNLLIERGFLTPAKPERPYKKGVIDKATGLPKMKKAEKAKLAAKKLKVYVQELCERLGTPVKMTDPSDTYPEGQVCVDHEVQLKLASQDPMMAQLEHRSVLNKLVTDFMPKLRLADTIHPQFQALVDSGRTSSSASKFYPSIAGQNVDPRVRSCFVARPGNVLLGCDYSAIELASFGQVTYELFGKSIHRDLINDGYDLHSYLAAQLLTRLPLDNAFRDKFLAGVTDPLILHDAFKASEAIDPDGYNKWRQFAKAPGFGLIGGMGPDRFRDFCRSDYGIEITLDESKAVIGVWKETYQEALDYFKYVKRDLGDRHNIGKDKETGEPKQKFAYTSPMGMHRAGTDYCSAANGMGCQTRAAEGAVFALFQVVRECYDPTLKSVLYGCHVLLFVHDEIIMEIPNDELMHERAMRLSQIMVSCMRKVIPDVDVEAEPCLMLVWNKKAKPVYKDKRLQIWMPKEKQVA